MRTGDRRRFQTWATIVAAALLFAGCGARVSEASPGARSASAESAQGDLVPKARLALAQLPKWPRDGWVSVPVASVWDHLTSARPVDAPDLSASPQVAEWLSRLTFGQRLGLDNLLATQALLNDPVVVLGETGAWAHVLVSGQRGAVWRKGVAGWMAADQITFRAPPAAPRTATVAVPMVRAGGLTLSYGTRLPVLASTRKSIVVATPAGRATLPFSVARLSPAPRSGPAVVLEAERFLGLPYLWAGTSAYGFDCSGLTYMVYRQFGVSLARDAADQARAGRPVTLQSLQLGDLVFFAFSGPKVDHVGIYAGNGMMIDAPETGRTVELVPLSDPGLMAGFAGARRYLS